MLQRCQSTDPPTGWRNIFSGSLPIADVTIHCVSSARQRLRCTNRKGEQEIFVGDERTADLFPPFVSLFFLFFFFFSVDLQFKIRTSTALQSSLVEFSAFFFAKLRQASFLRTNFLILRQCTECSSSLFLL